MDRKRISEYMAPQDVKGLQEAVDAVTSSEAYQGMTPHQRTSELSGAVSPYRAIIEQALYRMKQDLTQK